MLIVFMISSGFYALGLGAINLQIAKNDGTFLFVSSCASVSDALTAMNQNASEDAVITNESGTVLAMKRGMAVSATYLQSMANQTLSFIDNYGDNKPYITNGYAMYFNSSSVYNGEFVASVSISGLTNRALASQLRLIPYVFYEEGGAFADKYFLDFYSVNGNNELVHNLSTFTKLSDSWKEVCEMYPIVVDKAPSFMSQEVRYYSSDGKNFYSDSKLTNKVGTHYIYYKYLSYRSKTNYTEAELNSYIQYTNNTYNTYSTDTQSAILNKAAAFLNAQNNYGINAALEIAFANHESYYGKSNIAITKNNLFGINAVDSNPNQAADSFFSIDDCISEHTRRVLSRGYFDAYAYIPSSLTINDPVYDGGTAGGDWRYFGSSAGNKAFGVNVAYASDPYHGEKIAAHMYRLDKYLGFKDYKNYKLGETNKITEVYSGPDINSQKLYQLSHRRNNSYPLGIPVIILGEQGNFYKIQSDMPVRFDVAGNTSGLSFYKWSYDLNTAVAFVLKSDINAENAPTYETVSMTMTENEQKTIDKTGLPATLEYLSGDIAIATVTVDGIISAVDAGNTTITIKDSSTGLTVRQINLKVNSIIIPPSPIASNVYNVNGGNKIISKIAGSTTVAAFLAGFDNTYIKVYKGQNEISGNSLLTTGSVVKLIKDGTVYETYTIAITGDIDSDGEITIADYVALKNHLLKKNILSNVPLLCADIDGDGEAIITDYVFLKNHLLKKAVITPKTY